MRVVAALAVLVMAWRWATLGLGLVRARRFAGPQRREARRACVTRLAFNVFGSVAVLYLWAQTLRLQPTPSFVGFLAFLLMGSLTVGVLSTFMQPAERTEASLDLFRTRTSAGRGHSPGPARRTAEPRE